MHSPEALREGLVIHDHVSDCHKPEAAIDTFDFNLEEFDLGTDPSDGDITQFYECLEEEAHRPTHNDRRDDIAHQVLPAGFSKDKGRPRTGTSAYYGQNECLELEDGLNTNKPTIEAAKSPDPIRSGGSKYDGLSIAELVQRVIGQDSRGTINRETNALCAQILNHPELTMHPEVLPIYACYNGKIREYTCATHLFSL